MAPRIGLNQIANDSCRSSTSAQETIHVYCGFTHALSDNQSTTSFSGNNEQERESGSDGDGDEETLVEGESGELWASAISIDGSRRNDPVERWMDTTDADESSWSDDDRPLSEDRECTVRCDSVGRTL
ncbi:hypothetical protein AOQ84DRAFT_409338 [Glonium stellatum]|uniref:Uncharacterized protein n=1 Tax=Glonium stellatum TaxID=574774 RepID=A0A8E2JRZ6_9PEZI|nr:hypothetical protein AOQ84DRAFT_409338 [Glonium stellatum]